MPRPELPAANNDELDKIVRLSDKDVRDAVRLFRILADAGSQLPGAVGDEHSASPPPSFDSFDSQDLLTRAKLILSSRRLRSRHFNPAIFGEPAWDILLVLYITDVSGGRQTIGKVADWIKTPPTTVLRWVSYLEKEKFLERYTHPTDRRITFLRLLARGRDAMNSYLSDLPQ